MVSFFDRITGSRPANPPLEPRERTNLHANKLQIEESESETPAVEAEDEEGQLTVDIYEDGDHIVVQSFVGGSKPEDLDVEVTDEAVTIKGKRMRSHEVREENFYYRELYWGKFARSIILPQEVLSDEAEATMKNGLLTIRLPKRDRNKSQKLRVRSTE